MKTSFLLRLPTLAGAVVLGTMLAAPAPSHAQSNIIVDSFSGANSTTLNGRTPDTADRPGGTYTVASLDPSIGAQPVIDTSAGSPVPSADTGFNAATWISIASGGSYIKPTVLNLSISLQIGSLQEDNSSSARGIGLGFFTTTPATSNDAHTGFTGLNAEPSGALTLEVNGTRTGAAAPAPLGFSVNNFYQLSYTVNTSTGAISNVLYNGVNDSAFFAAATTSLTAANTNMAGFYGSSANSATATGRVDNLAIVPEPSTWIGLLGGLIVLGTALRRRIAG